jgi:Fe-S-cluster containining protein
LEDSSNICLSCGLCCDGTLIGFVQVEQDELPAVREVMTIEEENGIGFFLQPCQKYCNGCTIYADRPSNCDKFNCGLLKSVQQEDLAFDEALKTIDEVKQKKRDIEKLVAALPFQLQSKSFYFQMVELKSSLEKKKIASTLSTSELSLLAAVADLNALLSRRFDLEF